MQFELTNKRKIGKEIVEYLTEKNMWQGKPRIFDNKDLTRKTEDTWQWKPRKTFAIWYDQAWYCYKSMIQKVSGAKLWIFFLHSNNFQSNIQRAAWNLCVSGWVSGWVCKRFSAKNQKNISNSRRQGASHNVYTGQRPLRGPVSTLGARSNTTLQIFFRKGGGEVPPYP